MWGALLVLIVLAAQFLWRDPGQEGQSPSSEPGVKEQALNLQTRGVSFTEAVYTRQFWLLCAMNFCYWFPAQAVMVHIDPHALELGVSPTIAANVLAVIGGVGIAGRLIMGAFADRAGNRLALIISFALMAAGLLWLQVAKEVWMLYVFAGIFGFTFGGLMTLFSPMTAQLFGLRSLGTIFGVAFFSGTIGGAVGPIVGGYIFDVTSSYQLVFLIYAAVSIIGIILTSFLRPVITKKEK